MTEIQERDPIARFIGVFEQAKALPRELLPEPTALRKIPPEIPLLGQIGSFARIGPAANPS